MVRFNTQPPEGGWTDHVPVYWYDEVSTHSRPKAAAKALDLQSAPIITVSTHSRPKAAGLINRPII